MTHFDFYEAAEHLAHRLRKAGFDSDADCLVNAVRDGFTATEILMTVRRCIIEVLPRLSHLPSERDLSQELLDKLNEALA